MSSQQIVDSQHQILPFPDHTQLPESDGTFVKNFQEHPQSVLLTDSIEPILEKKHQDGQYCIGQDCGIYWRLTEPLERGAESPDWFYVPNVPPKLAGEVRRSYVLWQELIPPLVVIEFVSGDGSEERDKTPLLRQVQEETQRPGKFWIYEQIIRPAFYAIYEVKKARVEVYVLMAGEYQLLEANERGHYFIPTLGVELGIWQGQYQNLELPWLRWWDEQGNLLLTGWEKNKQTELQLEQAELQLEQERQRAEKMAEFLRSQGINPEDIS